MSDHSPIPRTKQRLVSWEETKFICVDAVMSGKDSPLIFDAYQGLLLSLLAVGELTVNNVNACRFLCTALEEHVLPEFIKYIAHHDDTIQEYSVRLQVLDKVLNDFTWPYPEHLHLDLDEDEIEEA